MRKKLWINTLLLHFLLLFSLFAYPAYAGEFRASIDRTQIAVGETFRLTLTQTGLTVNGRPDFTVLKKNFVILGTSHSTQLTVINGQSNASTQWALTLTAKRTGDFLIPSIRIGNDTSQAIRVHILARNAQAKTDKKPSTFLNASVDTKDLYVQSQLLYTLRLFSTDLIQNASLTDPQTKNAIILYLGNDKNYQQRHKGKLYRVLERRYAIFPQSSGQLTITPPTFSGLTASRSNYFTQMAPRPLRLVAPSISVKVEPIPPQLTGQAWLPAKHLSMTESWSKQKENFSVGDPITRTIIIAATGLTAAQLPKLSNELDLKNANVYSEQAVQSDKIQNSNLLGTRREKITYIPTQSGTLTLPAITMKWWNTKTAQLETASLPEKTFTIQAGKPLHANAPPSHTANTQAPTDSLQTTTVTSPSIWPWLTAGSLLAWLITLLFWYYHLKSRKKQIPKQSAAAAASQQSLKQVRTALQQACLDNNTHKVRFALLQWARLHWPDNPPLSLGAIAKNVKPSNLCQAIADLNKVFYAKHANDWQGKILWQAFLNYQKNMGKEKKTSSSPLASIYPEG